MTTTEHFVAPEDVMALLDGELSTADARVLSAHLEECAECALLAEQLRGTSESLLRWSVPAVPRAVEESVETRVAKTKSRGQMSRGKRSLSWKLVAAGCGGATLAVVLILANSPPRPLESAPVTKAYERAQLADRALESTDSLRSRASAPFAAGMAGIAQVSNGTLDANASSPSPLPPAAPMIARSISLTVLVKDVEAARGRLDAILDQHHGYSAHLNVNSPEIGPRDVRASLRFPASERSAAATEVERLGRVVEESQSGEEVSQQHADLVARLKTARETEQRFQAILAQRTGKLSDVLEVEQNIARVRGEIESMEAEQKELEHRVDFATLDVQLVEEYKAKLESPAVNSVSTRMHNAFVAGYHNAAESLLGLVLFAEEYGPVLLIWMAILGLPALAVWRWYKRARAEL